MPTGAFGGADYRQTITLALQAQGADQATIAADAIRGLQAAMEVLNAQYDPSRAKEYLDAMRQMYGQVQKLIPLTKEYSDLQAALGAMERRTADEATQAAGATAAARKAGTQAINDFAAATRAAAAAEEKEFQEIEQLNQAFQHNAQFVGMATRATKEQIQGLKELGIIQDTVTTRTRATSGQFGGFASAAEVAADRTKKMGYAAMNASYLVQDLQYGIGAVANNIGLMSTSLGNAFPKFDTFITKIGVPGGTVGLGAGVMLAAVAVDVLYHNWGKLSTALSGDPLSKPVNDLKAMNKELSELESKNFKTAFDYTEIDNQRKRIEGLTDALAAYKRLESGRTKGEQESAARVAEAIVEHGGGTVEDPATAKIVRAMQGAVPVADSDLTRRQRSRLAGMEADLGNFAETGPVADAMRQKVENARRELVESKAADLRNQAAAFQEILGKAGEGRAPELAHIRNLMEQNPERFAAQGIGPGLLPGLQRADLGRIRDEAAQANAAKIAADTAAQQKKILDDTNRLEAEAARNAERNQARIANDQQAEFNEWLHGEAFAGQQAKKSAAEQKRDAAAAERDARRAQLTPAQQKQQTEDAYGQQFQAAARSGALTGYPIQIGGKQAEGAGRQIAGLVEQGVDVNSAAQQALASLAALVNRQNMQALRNAADWEQLTGIVNGATQQLQMIEMQQRRATINTRTNNVHP